MKSTSAKREGEAPAENAKREGEAPAENAKREGEAPAEPRLTIDCHPHQNREGEAPAEPFSDINVNRDTRLGGSLALPNVDRLTLDLVRNRR